MHEATYGSYDLLARWRGPKVFSGYHDEPPADPEPESGSPEAVEQEAQELRGASDRWEENGRIYYTYAESPYFEVQEGTGAPVAQRGYHRDSMAGVFCRRIDALARQRDELAERVRQLEDSLEFSKAQVTDLAAWKNRLEETNRELANALDFLLRRAADWNEQGVTPSAPFESFPAVRQAREALRKAGRS